ncbi:MAG TPA: pitrilysin family protein [Eubacteriales bacterium]|nr:pitrilysin family protein [Eubacteriales bacterium]
MKTEFYKRFDSGLRLVFKKMPGLYTVSFGVLVGAGSRYETQKYNGYSHFIEHLLFKGTQKRTALDISEEIDAVGGQINAYTSKDTTCYYTRTASEYLEKGFDLISDMYFNATFAEKEFEMEKKVILEEISMDEDVPEDVCHDIIAESIFGKTPLAQKIVGSSKNIESATRDSVIDYKKSYYLPSNTVITIAGQADFDEICSFTEKYFESQFKDFSKEKIVKPEAPEYRNDFNYKFKDVEQSHISIAYPGFELGNPKSSAAAIAANILGGGMSSRLFQTIREKNGMAYSVYSFPSLYSNCGYMEIYCGTNPSNLKKLIPLLQKEMDKFRKEYFTKKEFDIGKAQLIGNTMLAQESSMTVMNAYGSYLIKKDTHFSIQERIDAIKNTTEKDVKNAIDEIFGGKCASAYVGKKVDGFDLVEKIR